MKRLLPVLLCALPLLGAAQSVPTSRSSVAAAALPSVVVPTEIQFAGLRLRLSEGGRSAVQQKVDALRRHPSSFQARVDLADAAFPIIDKVLQEEGVPVDFRYLCLQESGLRGDAQSIHDAVGYWQFKREAAIDFGLVVNDDIDERKHLVAGTHGAAKYLQRSQRIYQNWLHTLLSYNLGPTGVKPYTLPTDATASEMPVTETTHPYVLTFLAHKLAYEPAVGANPRPPMLLREYPAVAGQPLSTLAEAIQVSPAELSKHNRWLLAATVPSDKAYTALVPVTDSLQLLAMAVQQRQNASKLVTKPQTDATNAAFVTVNGLRAVVALPGESKEDLARRANLKLRKFLRFNDLRAFDNVEVGQPYFVQKKRDKAAVEYHVAQKGENVEAVSQKYGVRTRAIRSKNRMAANESLQPGRLLWLQHTRPREVAVEYVQDDKGAVAAALERPADASAEPVATAAPTMPQTVATAKPGRPASAPTAALADSTADATVENINDATDNSAPVVDTVPAPAQEAASAPSSKVYTGSTSKKPFPASAPVGDEPAPTDEAVTEPTPTSKPVVVAPPITRPTPAAPAPISAKPTPPAPAASSAPPSPATASSTAKPVVTAPTQPPTTTTPVPTVVEPVPANGRHVVEKGENLYSVARRFSLRPADIIEWNSLPPNPSLQIGQVLLVAPPTAATTATAATSSTAPAKPAAPKTATPSAPPTASAPAVAAAAGTVKHTVAAGESMYAISRKYEVTIKQIMEWNGKPDFNVRPGEVLVIRPGK